MRTVLRAFAPTFFIFSLVTQLAACGSYDTTKVKDYRMHVVNGTPVQVQTFQRLISDFNTFAGETVLTYADLPENANSPIIVTSGLKEHSDRGDKVGYGQWLSASEQENPLSAIGRSPTRTVKFSMRVEFDAKYFEAHKADTDDDIYARQKLFFHEIGHGLELEHDDVHKTNVMYPDIGGDKDFGGFFRYVRSYMADT